jgi:predicted metal-binding membrane protein
MTAARRHPEVLAGLLLASALAWWWTAARMAGMPTGPGTDLGTFGWFTGSWVAMMAAMMLPSFAPMLAAHVTRASGHAGSRSVLFAFGYLIAWSTAGVGAYAIYRLGDELLGGVLAWHRGGRWACGAVIAAAAAYQFIPLKHACLARCRGELGAQKDVPSARASGALASGLRSGGWCIGCSWALMAALFALGVMSLTWMALIAALVAVEKTGRRPRVARLITAAVLVALAVTVLVAPHELPGFSVPGPAGMHMAAAMR